MFCLWRHGASVVVLPQDAAPGHGIWFHELHDCASVWECEVLCCVVGANSGCEGVGTSDKRQGPEMLSLPFPIVTPVHGQVFEDTCDLALDRLAIELEAGVGAQCLRGVSLRRGVGRMKSRPLPLFWELSNMGIYFPLSQSLLPMNVSCGELNICA